MTGQEIARTILNQLGGQSRLVGMCGARNFIHGENYIVFSLPSNFAKNGINRVKITHNVMDTYDLRFYRVWGYKVTDVADIENVYCDSLQEIFSDRTGLTLVAPIIHRG